ncbi:MAG: hypothetical protein FJ297_15130 [Planctomycetes bacterium]|nr:hypothetical protein [Planctomycetota bacterium]
MRFGREADRRQWPRAVRMTALCLILSTGCGTTQSNLATQQLLMSDAVDRAVGRIDFGILAGQKVFLDDQYIQNVKGLGFVNSEYYVSALRQQMFAAGCRLQDKVEEADIVVEARVGSLATDAHDVTYGMPASKALSSGLSTIPNVPDLPTMPEVSVGRRSDQVGAAKILVYAYDRPARVPIWQSGASVAFSDARNTWVLGIGPFQTGSIYHGPRFAGTKLRAPWRRSPESAPPKDVVPIDESYTFRDSNELPSDSGSGEVRAANHESMASPSPPAATDASNTASPGPPAPAAPMDANGTTPSPAAPDQDQEPGSAPASARRTPQ